MARAAIAAVVGGLILFVWGFLFWAIWEIPQQAIQPLPNQDQITDMFRASVRESGTYWYPAMPERVDGRPPQPADEQEFRERHLKGPVCLLFYNAQGFQPMAPHVFVQGLTVNIVSTLLAAVLLTGARLRRYLSRVAFLVALGGLVAINSFVKQGVWLHLPTDYVWIMAADTVGGWACAAVVMAAIVRPGEDPVLAK